MNFELPTRVEVCGEPYDVRYGCRHILDIMEALADPELTNREKSWVTLDIFYPAFSPDDAAASRMPSEHYNEAIKRFYWFLNGGKEEPPEKGKAPRLVDWAKDFTYIAPAVSKALGVMDIREIPDLHWWTFLGGYANIGDCLWAQIVRIRYKKARNKPLDKTDREFYRQNREIIDLKTTYTEAEDSLIAQWTQITPAADSPRCL